MERYSTRETLQHPWFSSWEEGDDGAPREEVDLGGLVTVHEMMRGFIAQQRLKRAGLVVMACWRFQRAARGWPSDEAEDAPHDESAEQDAPEAEASPPPHDLPGAIAADEDAADEDSGPTG